MVQPQTKIAYLHRAPRKTWVLKVCDRPCNGAEFAAAPSLPFSNKTEARAYCAAHGLQPWNF